MTQGGKIRAAIFDAYGTLLDVHSATARHAERVGPEWQRFSQDWRAKQLEYTWVRSLAGLKHHRDFAAITEEALRVVAVRYGIHDAMLLRDLYAAYLALDAYAEVPEMLRALRACRVRCAILSNGEPRMLAEGIAAAGIAELLDAVLSVESVGVFKPDPRVYRLASEHFSLMPNDMGFVSSNAWDAFGAREAGFRVFWVNRAGQPDEYGLRGTVQELPDLVGLPALLA